MTIRKSIPFLSLLLLLPFQFFSQTIETKRLCTEGDWLERTPLRGLQVYDILQDSRGLMWFATQKGLMKFDGASFTNYEHIDLKYNYLQFIPSYAYNIRKRKFNIPIELGIAINKRIKEEDIFYVGITEYNYDFRLSTGIQYNLNNFTIGSNVVYSKSIANYETENVKGEYKPYQIGIELGIGYILTVDKENCH